MSPEPKDLTAGELFEEAVDAIYRPEVVRQEEQKKEEEKEGQKDADQRVR